MISIAPSPKMKKEREEAKMAEEAMKRAIRTMAIIRFLKFTFFFVVLGGIIGLVGNLF
jgi:hypothetical protein